VARYAFMPTVILQKGCDPLLSHLSVIASRNSGMAISCQKVHSRLIPDYYDLYQVSNDLDHFGTVIGVRFFWID
jgi:hypothetical protein